jgi:CRP-like cAMP-binding protein
LNINPIDYFTGLEFNNPGRGDGRALAPESRVPQRGASTHHFPKEQISMTTDTMSALRQCAFFEEFAPRHIDKLMALGSEIHFDKDEVIFREGDKANLFYVIVSGRVALESNANGREVRIQLLYPGDELGWSAVLNRPRQFQARALEPVQAMYFEVSQLRDACIANPYFGCAFLERLFRVVAERLESTRLQLASVLAEIRPPRP